jgi:hypothetical protein
MPRPGSKRTHGRQLTAKQESLSHDYEPVQVQAQPEERYRELDAYEAAESTSHGLLASAVATCTLSDDSDDVAEQQEFRLTEDEVVEQGLEEPSVQNFDYWWWLAGLLPLLAEAGHQPQTPGNVNFRHLGERACHVLSTLAADEEIENCTLSRILAQRTARGAEESSSLDAWLGI